MPELPDITIYVEALTERIAGQRLIRARITGPFLLRTADPPIDAAPGRRVLEVRRLGKRIAIGLEDGLWLVLHLMIAGRLHWQALDAPFGKKGTLAAFDFPAGRLTLTEAGSKKRASLHLLRGEEAVRALDPGGLEVLDANLPAFAAALTSSNHTLKRALTDPALFSGIGNAYSDEILHQARLSPVALARKLTKEQISDLYEATRRTLMDWTEAIRKETQGRFPEKVTAFRKGMAVHGRYRRPCPVCGTPVQRIRYAENETNYCPQCQTGGKLLADRSMSRLLRDDWPRTLEELELRLKR